MHKISWTIVLDFIIHPNRQSKYGGFMSADELHNAKYRASNYGPDDDFDPIY